MCTPRRSRVRAVPCPQQSGGAQRRGHCSTARAPQSRAVWAAQTRVEQRCSGSGRTTWGRVSSAEASPLLLRGTLTLRSHQKPPGTFQNSQGPGASQTKSRGWDLGVRALGSLAGDSEVQTRLTATRRRHLKVGRRSLGPFEGRTCNGASGWYQGSSPDFRRKLTSVTSIIMQ